MFRSKTGFLLYISISLIIISGIIFYYTNIIIPDKESKACERLRYEIDINAMPSKSVVILKKEKLAKNTVLSEEIIKESFQILKVPVIFLVNDYIEDINYLKDKVLVESAYQNQQITKNSIKKRENLLKK
jgi:lipopolysaccharide export LptBFGC system permease protein LptF